jgi:hypothetical protein
MEQAGQRSSRSLGESSGSSTRSRAEEQQQHGQSSSTGGEKQQQQHKQGRSRRASSTGGGGSRRGGCSNSRRGGSSRSRSRHSRARRMRELEEDRMRAQTPSSTSALPQAAGLPKPATSPCLAGASPTAAGNGLPRLGSGDPRPFLSLRPPASHRCKSTPPLLCFLSSRVDACLNRARVGRLLRQGVFCKKNATSAPDRRAPSVRYTVNTRLYAV